MFSTCSYFFTFRTKYVFGASLADKGFQSTMQSWVFLYHGKARFYSTIKNKLRFFYRHEQLLTAKLLPYSLTAVIYTLKLISLRI